MYSEARPQRHDWMTLEKNMRAEECFCTHNLSAEVLAKRYYADMAGVAFNRDSEPVAYAGLWNTTFFRTYELGKLWVRKHYRGIESWKFLEAAIIPGTGLRIQQLSHAVIGRCDSILSGNGPGLGFNGHMFTRVPALAEYIKSCGWQVQEGEHMSRKSLLRGITEKELLIYDPHCNEPCFWCYVINHDPHKIIHQLYEV